MNGKRSPATAACVKDYVVSADNQFGFKKGVGCSFAIRTVRNIVDSYVKGGSTANLCTIDLSKAFDKVNHDVLFLKLMKRRIPNYAHTLRFNGHFSR